MNHYEWLDKYLPEIFKLLNINWDWNAGIIGAHGDKCYSYKSAWEENGIPFEHGVAIYLLTYCRPFAKEVRDVGGKWVDVNCWVMDNYQKFLPVIEQAIKNVDKKVENMNEKEKDISSIYHTFYNYFKPVDGAVDRQSVPDYAVKCFNCGKKIEGKGFLKVYCNVACCDEKRSGK